MKAFLYGTALQWRLDLRSKSLLITCYVVPLLFYALMGGIFTSINPESKATLIQMCIRDSRTGHRECGKGRYSKWLTEAEAFTGSWR